MCLFLCVPWLTPLCLVPCMSLSHVIVSWFGAAWTQARISLGCVLMILRKGEEHTEEFFYTTSFEPFVCSFHWVSANKKQQPDPCLQVCRLWLHADHQECTFPPRWTICGWYGRRKTLSGLVQRNEGWLQYCRYWTLGGQQSKSYRFAQMMVCVSLSCF